jgi:hypothetical protein
MVLFKVKLWIVSRQFVSQTICQAANPYVKLLVSVPFSLGRFSGDSLGQLSDPVKKETDVAFIEPLATSTRLTNMMEREPNGAG